MAEYTSLFAFPYNIDSVKAIKQHIQKILQFLKIYEWVLDIYVSDFFVLNYWEKLLPSWRNCFQKMTTSDIAELLTLKRNTENKIILPLSLLAYRSCIQSLSLKRTIASDKELSYVLEALTANVDKKISAQLPTMNHVTDDPKVISNIKYSGGQYVSLDAHYRKHVKPKKQHEIHQMSKVIGNLCQIIKCDKVVDVGAGLGHLSRLLNFKYKLAVTTVEATGGHAAKAHKFDLDLWNNIKKRKKKIQDSEQKSECPIGDNTTEKKPNPDANDSSNHVTSLPNHVIHQVVNDISAKDFLQLLQMPSTCREFDSNRKVNLFDMLRNTNFEEHYRPKENNTVNFHANYVTFGSIKDKNGLPSACQQSSKYRQICRTCSESNLNQSVSVFNENSLKFRTKSSSSLNLFDEKLKLKEPRVSADQLVLCGLHACGDLTATLIQMFTQSQDISALAIVGCCYMKLSTSSDCSLPNDANNWGYPMSQHLQTLHHHLTYEARELACHFVDAYHKRLLENMPSLRRHWYRASLQCVVKAIQPTFKHGCIKISIKKVENLSFEVYLEKALKSLGFSISEVPAGIIDQCKATENQWKDVVCFYTVRLSIAPVIETLLLLDRMLYILESGIPCALVPIFEPLLSPRNFILLAAKPSH